MTHAPAARRTTAVLAAAAAALLLSAIPVRALEDPSGTYEIPTLSFSKVFYEDLRISSEVGALTPSYEYFRWSAPSVRHSLPGGALIGEPIRATGNFVVGVMPYGDWQLTRLDLRDGTVAVRDAPSQPTPVGATDSAWVAADSDGITLYPFDTGLPETLLTPPEGTYVEAGGVAVGPHGVVYVIKATGPDGDQYRLMHTSANLTTHTILAELGGTLPSSPGSVHLATSGDAVALTRSDTATLVYVELGNPATTVALPGRVASAEISVVTGAVAFLADDGDYRTTYLWVRGQAFPSAPFDIGADLTTLALPAATSNGTPAFVVNRDHWESGARWAVVNASTGRVAYNDSGTVVKPSFHHATGSPGIALVRYGKEPSSDGQASIQVYGVGSAAAITRLVISGPSQSGWSAFDSSGARTAAVEETSDWRYDGVVRLRYGSTLTGSVPVTFGEMSLASSGPFTALGPDSWGSGARGLVVLPDGRVVAVLPPDLAVVAQYGPLTAYAEADGSIWLRDIAAPISASNPRRAAGPCPPDEPDCRTWLGLSSRWLVQSTQLGGTDPVVTLYDLRTLEEQGSLELAGVGAGALDLSGDLLVVGGYPTLSTVDLTSRPLALIARMSTQSSDVALAGDRLVLPRSTPEGDTVAIAPIPAGWGDLGAPAFLGTWSRYGEVVSTAGPAWTPTPAFGGRLDSWTFKLWSSTGALVRTWRSTGPTSLGQVSGITWRARSASGTPVPAGIYRWTVTGSGPHGGPVGLYGTGTATGTVTVVVQAPATTSISSPASVRRNQYAMVSGKVMKKGSTTPAMYEPVTLWRRSASSTSWVQIATGRTGSQGGVAWRVKVSSSAYYQVRHDSTPRYATAWSSARLIRTT